MKLVYSIYLLLTFCGYTAARSFTDYDLGNNPYNFAINGRDVSSNKISEDENGLKDFYRWYEEELIKRANERDYPRSIKTNNCRPMPTLMSTYTHLKGIQTPRTIYTNRCQGGHKNPENYQCQPSKLMVTCFHTSNGKGEDDFLGTYSHTTCEERCVCGRKSCKNQNLYELICPKGFKEDKKTCQCLSVAGESIFYRNQGIVNDWDSNLHLLCRSQHKLHQTKIGETFTLQVN